MSRPVAWERRSLAGGRLIGGAVLGLAALLGLRFLLADDGFPALRAQRSQLQRMQAELAEIHAENGRLERAIESLRHDPHAIERIAREELDLAAPGEWVYFFAPDMIEPEDDSAVARQEP